MKKRCTRISSSQITPSATTRSHPTERPSPPPPVVHSPETAATNFSTDYSTRLADVAGDIAQRAAAGDFADLTAVNDAWVAGSKTAREQSQAELIQAMNQSLQETEGTGADAAPLFRELAAGFRKGAIHAR